jgi:hypothetical protein
MNKTKTPETGKNGLLFFQNIERWVNRQGWKRLLTFVVGALLFEIAMSFDLVHLHRHPNQTAATWAMIGTIAFAVLWPFVCFYRFKKSNVAGKKIHRSVLCCVWVTTLYLSLFCALPHAAHAAQITSNTTATQVDQTHATSQPTQANPKIGLLCFLWAMAALTMAAYALYLIWQFCKAAGLCGGSNTPPPQSPPGSSTNNNSVVKASLGSPMPITTFYLQGGQVVSNSAGLNVSGFPPLFSLGGAPVPNGAQISATTPGISTPPSMALWTETGTYADANLDPTHNYQIIENYTLLTTTNLNDGWQELCTVISWVNGNQGVPLIASVFYTNGAPMTTNWTQLYLDNHQQPTNIVIHGVMPAFDPTGTQTALKSKGLLPPGNATNVANGDLALRLYRMVCNTNQLSTGWTPKP